MNSLSSTLLSSVGSKCNRGQMISLTCLHEGYWVWLLIDCAVESKQLWTTSLFSVWICSSFSVEAHRESLEECRTQYIWEYPHKPSSVVLLHSALTQRASVVHSLSGRNPSRSRQTLTRWSRDQDEDVKQTPPGMRPFDLSYRNGNCLKGTVHPPNKSLKVDRVALLKNTSVVKFTELLLKILKSVSISGYCLKNVYNHDCQHPLSVKQA